MNLHEESTVVPFDDRLERVATVTDDGEVIGVEYRLRELWPFGPVPMRPVFAWGLVVSLVCVAVMLSL